MTEYTDDEIWAMYAESHEACKRGEYHQDDNDLTRLGWQEIDIGTPTNLEALFTPELTAMCCNFFESEFAVIFRSEMERQPGEVDVSALWHLDHGPFAHLRIMIPLTENDGGTAVVSIEDTEKCPYRPEMLSDRRVSLEGYGNPPAWFVSPSIGQALIFQPTRVLHMAVPPKTSVRRVYQLGLIPWNEPWQRFDEKYGARFRSNRNTFPRERPPV
jgi:hypothetical protein